MLFVVSCLINDAVGIPCSADGISSRECRAARSEPKRVIEEHQADVASSSLGDKVARPHSHAAAAAPGQDEWWWWCLAG